MSVEPPQDQQVLAFHQDLLRESDYELTEMLPDAESSVAFLATKVSSGRTVAIKWLNLVSLVPTARERLVQKAKSLKGISHRHIMMVHEFLPIRKHSCYIVMEDAEHSTLRELIEQTEGGLPVDEVIDIGIAMCRALTTVHAQGVVHGDVRPANILLCAEAEEGKPVPKLAAFGIARELTAIAMTKKAYKPPEALEGEEGETDERQDVYGLGATLYEALTGRLPRGSSPADLYQHLDRPPASLRTFRSKVPIWLDDIMLKALAPNREDRYRTMEEMLTELEAGKKSLEAKARRRVWAVVGVTIAVALAISLIVWLQGWLPLPATTPTISPTVGASAVVVASPTQTATATPTLTPSRSPSSTPATTPASSSIPTREPMPSPTPTTTPTETPTATAAPRVVQPKLESPENGELLNNPIPFQWQGSLSGRQMYQVRAYHGGSSYITQTGLLSENSWTVYLPAEKWGGWRWNVSVVQDGRTVSTSDDWGFYFDPYAPPGKDGDSNGVPTPPVVPPTPPTPES